MNINYSFVCSSLPIQKGVPFTRDSFGELIFNSNYVEVRDFCEAKQIVFPRFYY